MTLNELRYIVALDTERHFGRAAEACFISQPTLSIAVKKLEDELGVPIFERSRQEVRPTESGREIISRAREILEGAEELKHFAKQSGDRLRDTFRIGLIHTVGPSLLPYLIPSLNEIAPQMPVVVEEGYTHELRRQLKHGKLDAIIVALPFSEPGVETRLVYEEDFIVLIPESHQWSQMGRIKPKDLIEESVLMLGEGHCFRDQVLEICPSLDRRGHGNTQQGIVGGSLETIRHMVASGVGVTVLPCSAAGADRFAERLVTIKRFAGTPPKRDIAIAWRKRFPRAEAIEALSDAIRNSDMSCVRYR